MFDFSGQTAMVTGGTRGIGLAITEAFLAAGARVIATYHANDAAADALKAAHPEAQDRLTLARFDVSDYEQVAAFFNDLPDRFDSLEILVNNSGIRRDGVLASLKQADWDRVLAVNLDGTYHCCKFAVQAMMPQRYGRIINLTSPSGKFGFEGQANYAASKAGIVALTRSLAKETAKRRITVNCISPGFIDTDLIADLPEEQRKAYQKSVPMKRFGTTQEIAHATLFLATREAAYITGATLSVTGGL